MEGKRTIHSIKLKNILSFGSEEQELVLQPLNVLIGPNASGKSNLIEVFRFLSAISQDPAKIIRDGGGISEYLYKTGGSPPSAKIEVTLAGSPESTALTYRIAFTEAWQTFKIVEEAIAYENPSHSQEGYQYPSNGFYGRLTYKSPIVNENIESVFGKEYSHQEYNIDSNRSILSLVKDFIRFPFLSHLDSVFSNIQCFTGWNFERYGPVRTPQKVDLPTDTLWEDASNLGLILNNYPQKTKLEIVERLKQVYEPVDEIQTRVEGGTIQIFLYEKGLPHPIPAIRLSQGTLRYLCLLTLLLHPNPPQLICLEEPETGLHPDVIHGVAQLLIEASQRTQLIVTTHSSSLISALSNIPESVIVCERESSGTTLRRLDRKSLEGWLERYELGELWEKGVIGGTRW